MLNRFPALITLLLLLAAGANAQSDSVQQRIILIGDAGEMHNGTIPVIDAIRRNINLQQGKNTILYLGDNVYPLGLPDPAAKNRREKENILDYQASLVKGTKAEGIFVPGNHDWSKHRPYGWRSIVQQQHYIDSMQLPNLQFLPKAGCPGPEAVPLGDNVLLIIMDTEWWLYPGAKPGIESGCDCKTEDEVLAAIADIAARNPGKLMIFAGHHPLRSHGPHGGYYKLKQHIFPLTEAKRYLYVPLPVIGSIYPLVRGVFGTREDIPHPLYKRMIKGIESSFPEDAPVVFVSGHDHTLQHIREGNRNFIVSGAGAKDNQVKMGKNSLFATCENGYTVVEVLHNGKVNVRFYNDQNSAPLYAAELVDLAAYRRRDEALAATPLPEFVTVAADSQYLHANGFHRLMLGSNYRKVWGTAMTFPVMRFDTLKILKRGGGKQTRSLRLEDKSGREWVLRSLKKDPLSAVPEALRETFAREIVQDQISAANPYAPLTVSPLAEVAGVPHTNPRFVYVANDTALGIYRKDFADGVYLFEEREPVTASKTYNSLKLLEELVGDNDNSVNQKAYLQARLLDIFIADWDRHEDQWRWYAEKDKKTKVFYPIPRDRDQAFFVNQGVIPRIADARYIFPAVQGFRKKIPDISGWNFNPRYLDRNMLTGLEEDTWQTMSRNLAAKMTDSVIISAVNQQPAAIRREVDSMMISTLKARRDILEKEALKYYRALAKNVDVTGSMKSEQFTVTRQPDGFLNVTAQKISKKGELEQALYNRTFNPKQTKEVVLYGLGGEDRFIMRGTGRSPIRVRIIGGRDKDTYIDSSSRAGGKRVVIYDLRGKDSFAVNRNEVVHLSANPEIIHYNRKAFKYNVLMPRIAGGYNLDDGLLLGVGLEYTGHGFRKDSFAVRHIISGMHALATEAYQFKYQGQFNDVIGKSDLLIGALIRSPHNTANFFGFGNETEYNKNLTDPPIQYYRGRFNIYMGEASLRTNLAQNISFTITPSITYATLNADDNAGRYLTNYNAHKIDSAQLFSNKLHTGLRAGFNIDTRDNDLVATRGLLWTTTLQGNKGLNGASNDYAQLRSDMSIYASLGLPPNVVFVARVGGGVTWGKPEFFQSLSLGGSGNLRGFRNNRFTGTSLLYNNLELRVKLFDFTSYIIPGSVGLIAFNDVGRVWVKEEKSGQWHNGFGGGVYVSPINMFIITAVLGHSNEGTLPYVTFGFKF